MPIASKQPKKQPGSPIPLPVSINQESCPATRAKTVPFALEPKPAQPALNSSKQLKLNSTRLTTKHRNYLIRVDQVGQSLWMFSVLNLQYLEITKGYGFLNSHAAQETAKNTIDELCMGKPLEVIDYKYHRIEVYPARQKNRYKSTVFDLAQRRKFFSEICKSIEMAIAVAKDWIDGETRKC